MKRRSTSAYGAKALGMFLCGALLCTAAPIRPASAEEPGLQSDREGTKRYTLIVAHNQSVDAGVKPLRYADDDGARYYELFSQLSDETTLLTVLDADSQRVFPGLAKLTRAPSREELSGAVSKIARQIEEDREAGLHVEVVLVFTGHGHVDESGRGYLSLSDGKLTRDDLYDEVLAPLQSDYTHLIIDACQAYFMVQARGDDDDPVWRDDRSGRAHEAAISAYLEERGDAAAEETGQRDLSSMSRLGVILSTSGAAEVHEWSALRAGVFSHQLRSALLGGADVDRDGRITYLEIEAFLAAANAGVTNPRARISVFARAPAQDQQRALLELSDYRDATTLTLKGGSAPRRYELEDARGLRYADLNTSPDQPTSIMLLRSPVSDRDYYLKRDDSEQAVVAIEGGGERDASALEYAALESSARSSVTESFRAELFSTPYGPGFFAGFAASKERYEALREADRQSALAQRASLTMALARADQATPRWRARPGLSYGLSGSPSEVLYGEQSVQHNLALELDFRHRGGFAIGPFLSYGLSAPGLASERTSSAVMHRLALGAQLGYARPIGRALTLNPRLRLGQQALLIKDETLCDPTGRCSDPLGLRSEAQIVLDYKGFEHLEVGAYGGLSLDLFSRAGLERNEETLYWTPTLGFGLAF